MTTLVFFLEESSTEEMLKGLLPKFLPSHVQFKCIPFEGKQDLEKNIQRRIHGWRIPDTYFIILRDKDHGDCYIIKQNLVDKCSRSGKTNFLVRIACHELESWYLGDLAAIEQAYQIRGISKKQLNRKYKTPDRIANPVQELERLTNYQYTKVAGSRKIGPFLNIQKNRSHSFNIFISGIKRLVANE